VAFVLVTGLLAVVGLCLWQVRAIQRSRYPAVQAIEGLAFAVPLFLLLFAAGYYVLAGATPGAFTEPVNRTDALHARACGHRSRASAPRGTAPDDMAPGLLDARAFGPAK
jgi:hypothetical protein